MAKYKLEVKLINLDTLGEIENTFEDLELDSADDTPEVGRLIESWIDENEFDDDDDDIEDEEEGDGDIALYSDGDGVEDEDIDGTGDGAGGESEDIPDSGEDKE